jgi:hypothetical protein
MGKSRGDPEHALPCLRHIFANYKSKNAITNISANITGMWRVLYPDQPIDVVRLYLPGDDKAIDSISIYFFRPELQAVTR